MGCDDIGVGYGRRQHGRAAAAKGLTGNAPQRVGKTKTTKKWPCRLVARRACRDHSVPCAGRDRPTFDSDAKRYSNRDPTGCLYDVWETAGLSRPERSGHLDPPRLRLHGAEPSSDCPVASCSTPCLLLQMPVPTGLRVPASRRRRLCASRAIRKTIQSLLPWVESVNL